MKKFLLIAVAALGLTACTNTKPSEADLVILYTTDVHGACLAFDIKRNAPAQTSLANVSTYLNKVREENPGKVLVFDTGDFLQGQPSMYYYNYIDTVTPHVCARTYNYLQYDAIGVGNHDIETGDENYEQRLPGQFQMPWLCANAIDTRTNEPMFQPYAVYDREGLKVAVLGMITPHIGAWLPKNLWPNLEFEDMVECAQKWVPIIQEREKPDLLIGLFHAGTDFTASGNDFDTRFNENGSLPAALKVPGFDLCLLGHDHNPQVTLRLNATCDTVHFIDAGTQARRMGRADIHFTRQDDGSYEKRIRTTLVDMEKYAPDSAYIKEFEAAVDSVNIYCDRPLGTLTEPLVGVDGLLGPSAFVDLIHDAQLWASNAEISLASVLSPNDVVPAGDITMRHLFTIYKYENLLNTIHMTADEIRQYLEYGYNKQFNTMHSAKDHLLNWLPAAPGKRPQLASISFNYTSAAGIKYVVDVSKEPGHRVSLISMSDGSPIDPNKLYRVAINSYQYSGGGGFIPCGLGWSKEFLQSRTLTASEIDVRRFAARYIHQLPDHIYTPRQRGDWKVIPEAWWQEAKEREKVLLKNPTFH